MEVEQDERLWTARLRWRLRGAWQGPVFVLVTLAEAVVLNRMPPAGDDGLDPVGSVLLAGFANLAIVAVAGPVLAFLVARRVRTLPRAVVRDRTATGLMCAGLIAVLAGGIAHRAEVVESDRDHERQLAAARAYVAHQAGPEWQAGLSVPSTWKLADDRYRTCFPGPDPRRSLCLFVTTDGPQPTVRRDEDQRPNSFVAGPDNPARTGG